MRAGTGGEDTGLGGGKKAGKVVNIKEIFFGAKILAMIRHIFSVVWSSLLHTEINF